MTIPHLPDDRRRDMDRAKRLEWWTLGWMASVIAVMGLTAGASQAMRTAWIEDMLSLIPPTVFLIAARYERRPPDAKFPFGYTRVNSLGFLIAAVTLAGFGATLLFDAARTLLTGERVTIGAVHLLGRDIWAGWVMIAALAYSIVPPVILGRMKLEPARALSDKVLHTDALMNRADWTTGLAGIAGIVGLGFGYWWADAAAAGAISLSVLTDGIRSLRMAAAELVDGAPRALDSDDIAPDAQELHDALAGRYPGARIKMRETGRFIRVVVDAASPGSEAERWPSDPDRAWRLAEITHRDDRPDPAATQS